MNLSFSLPNPLSRLTGLLEALERNRSAAAAVQKVDGKTQEQADMLPGTPPTDRNEDLDSLSLSRCGDSLDPGSHDLKSMSLSRVERAGSSPGEGPGDANRKRR